MFLYKKNLRISLAFYISIKFIINKSTSISSTMPDERKRRTAAFLFSMTILLMLLPQFSSSLCIRHEPSSMNEEDPSNNRNNSAIESSSVFEAAESGKEATLEGTGMDFGVSNCDGCSDAGRAARDTAEKEAVRNGTKPVGDLLMDIYRNLPTVVAELLVELDIVNTQEVQQIRATGTLEVGVQPTTAPGNRSDTRQRKAAVGSNSMKWPNHRIPYLFHGFINMAAKAAVHRAMDEWERHTCVRFERKRNGDFNYIFIVQDHGCYSYIGRSGYGKQQLSIGLPHQFACRSHGVLLHEFGHAFGFWHEQTRPDRDNYVRIVTENMISGSEYQFIKYVTGVNSLGVPYDYHSIMHYSRKAFSRNNLDTLVPLDPNIRELGQKFRLSCSDILQANLLYGCPYIRNPSTPTNSPTNPSSFPPRNSFLIKNERTSTCLANVLTRDPFEFTRYTHEALYSVILVTCNSSSRYQQWQWTNNGSLLHPATFLCLAKHNDNNVHRLVLRTCKEEDQNQEWSCAGNFIDQPNSEECVTATVNRNSQVESSLTVQRGNKGSRSLAWNQSPNTSETDPKADLTAELESVLEELGHLQEEVTLMSSLCGINNTRERADVAVEVITVDTKHNATFEVCNQTNSYQKWSIMSFNGQNTTNNSNDSICSTNTTRSHNLPHCYVMDTEHHSMVTYGTDVWAACKLAGYYVKGFYHTYNRNQDNRPDTGLLSGIQCCAGDNVFTGEPDTSVVNKPDKCHDIPWWQFSSGYLVANGYGWFTCPRGMFLKGLLVSVRYFFPEETIIKKAKCCKTPTSAYEYMQCYTTIATSVADTGVHLCDLEGFLVTGVARRKCDSLGRRCTEEITCCMQV